MIKQLKKLFILALISFFMISCSVLPKRSRYSGKSTVGQKNDTRVNLYGDYKKDDYPISKKIPYLSTVNDLSSSDSVPFKKYSEREYLSFYKNLNVKGYGDESAYWRWKVTYSTIKMKYLLETHIKDLYRRRPKDILMYKNGVWIKPTKKDLELGDIKDIKIVQRGESGIAIKLLMRGTKGTFIVVKEANIRYMLGADDNIGSELKLYGADGGREDYFVNPRMVNPQLLPSAFIAIERQDSNFVVYGGGYGHGVGIPQWTVGDLTRNKGYSYRQVIKRYYKDTNLKNLKKVKGITKNINIKVGIMTSNFASIEHSKIKMYSTARIVIRCGAKTIKLPASSKIEFRVRKGRIEVICNGKTRLRAKTTVTVDSSGKIGLMNIKRNIKNYKYPMYRGKFKVNLSKSKKSLILVNELNIEEYLLQVVPSEMPATFGLEALKVQAIAARTYAVKDMLKNRYDYLGFNILDSAQSQVYNNLDENDIATKAVKTTKGLIIVYDGEPIDAKYYSTSSGINSHAHNVW